ncbi:MAG: O-antigen ligase family protein [Thermodesulfovibrionales bacterium]
MENDKKLIKHLSYLVEYGIYLYVFLLFFDKGEGLRTLGLYGAFTAWICLFSLKKINFTIDLITLGFFAFVISTLLSSFFSIEPLYSLQSLKRDILKATFIFFIVSTFFDIKMLLRLSKIICVAGLINLAFGLHSFFLNRTEFYTSENIFLSLDKNEFGFFINIFCPFFILFFVRSKNHSEKIFWGLSTLWAICAGLLSASRGAIAGVFSSIIIWSIYFLKRQRFKKNFIYILIFFILIIISFILSPKTIKEKLLSFPEDIKTFSLRTDYFWEPAIESVKKRPLLGWGYGNKIYRDYRPFKDIEKPNWELRGGLHSTFIGILFHQGMIGLLSYLLLLLSTILILINIMKNESCDKKLLAISFLSILVGAGIINSFVLSVPFRRIAPILGMSSALFKKTKNMESL